MADKTIAYTCPYVPAEWIAAHGLRPQRLVPAPAEGGQVVPRIEGLCPYARAFVNDVAVNRDVGGIVVTTACDQMRRVFDLLVRRVDTPALLLNVPSTWQTVAAQRLYLDELKRLGRFLVRVGGHEPTREDLMQAMLDSLQNDVLSDGAVGWVLNPRVRGASGETRGSRTHPTRASLALVGGPLMQRDRALFDMIEECGGQIVLDATETGQRGRPATFDRRRLVEDPLMELAQAYFRIPDASRRPNSELYRWLKEELARAGARGVLFHHYVWCDKWRAEFSRLKEWTELPVLHLDNEGDGQVNSERLRNRVRAFLEIFR